MMMASAHATPVLQEAAVNIAMPVTVVTTVLLMIPVIVPVIAATRGLVAN
jgi:hypothetical protein